MVPKLGNQINKNSYANRYHPKNSFLIKLMPSISTLLLT